MSFEIQFHFFIVGNFFSGFVNTVVPIRRDSKPGCRLRSAKQGQHRLFVSQGNRLPVFRNRTQQPVFHGIPFRSTGRIMMYGDDESRVVAQLLHLSFPQPGTMTIAPAAITLNRQTRRLGVKPLALATPPGTNRIHREASRVARRTHFDMSFAATEIINSIRDCLNGRLRFEVMRFDKFQLVGGLPFFSRVLEIPYIFRVFRINTDHRPTRVEESRSRFADQFELSVTIRMRYAGEFFHVAAKRKLSTTQPCRYGLVRNISDTRGDASRTQSRPFSFAGRQSSDMRFDDFFELFLDLGTFFSSGLHPPPGLRNRPSGTPSNRSRSSCFPFRRVRRSMPNRAARNESPPRPRISAKSPATCRRCCSLSRASKSSTCSPCCKSVSRPWGLEPMSFSPVSRNCETKD